MQAKRSKANSFVVCLVLGAVFLCSFVFWPHVVHAATRNAKIITPAQQDSYVHSGYGDSNYGGQDWFIIGEYYSDWTEAYFTFNYTNQPAGWTKAEICLDFYSVSATLDVTVSRVTEAWGEYMIKWVNKPAHDAVISTFTVAQAQVYTIDVTSFIAGTNISVCVNASDFLQTGHIQGSSREGGSGDLIPPPRLVWTYPEEAVVNVVTPASGVSWSPGTHNISWTSTGTITKVKIDLYKGGTQLSNITSSTPNDGQYDWYVSSSGNYDGTDYRVKISDAADPLVFGFSNYFTMKSNSSSGDGIPGYDVGILIVALFLSMLATLFRKHKNKL